MRYRSALDQAHWHITWLYRIVILLALVLLGLIWGWHHADANRNLKVMPPIPASGITMRVGDTPAINVYSFAYYVWQRINYWPTNGTQNYQNAINQNTAFLTPRFKAFLIRDYNNRFNNGEIQDRTRTLQGVNGSAFDSIDVKPLGHGTWIIYLTMRLTESMNINGNTVKDTDIRYALRVVTYDVNAKANPWGLALDGFAQSPERIKTAV